MRTNHLLFLALLVTVVLLFGGGYIPWIGIVFEIVGALPLWLSIPIILVPVLLVLTPINNYALLWRKRMGRDILAEERHEIEGGMISIAPTNKD